MERQRTTVQSLLRIRLEQVMIVAGLTGGVATGKSQAAAYLRQLGCKVVDADLLARRLLYPNSKTYRNFVHEFGTVFLRQDGSVNRKKVAQAVFADSEKMKRLNRLIHPPVIRQMRRLIEKNKKKSGLLVLDAPLLYEANAASLADVVIVIRASRKHVYERMKRKKIEQALTDNILKAQWPQARKEKLADFVAENNASLDEFKKKIKEVFIAIKETHKF